MKKEYKGKFISVLGDSISTFEGLNPEGYNVFYTPENQQKSGVLRVGDMWWGRVIKNLDAKLLVDNSWSGSRVTKLPHRAIEFPSGCSDERSGGLHTFDVLPDIIIIYLGTNDWAYGVPPVKNKDYDLPEVGVFDSAYGVMLTKIKRNYPNADIWCCTLCTTFMKSNPSFTFPHMYSGYHIEEYCEIIRNKARLFGCKLIDLYAENTPYDTIDGSHPTKKGMKTLSKLMMKYIGSFRD